MDRFNAMGAWNRFYASHSVQYGGSGELGALASVIKPGMIALDAGCGDGKTTEALARTASVVACDFSRDALLTMRTRRSQASSENMVLCNIVSMPFEQEKFDIVASFHSLSHLSLTERTRAASELSRVLKKEGYLMVEAFGRDDIRFGEGTEVEPGTFLRGTGIATHYFSKEEMEGMFPGLEAISSTDSSRRVAYGASSGKRNVVRVLFRKPA